MTPIPTPRPTRLALGLAAAGLWALAGSAQALDWNGYFRAGPGSTSKDGARACFGLQGEPVYRLGNECDFYGEFILSQALKNDNIDYRVNLTTNLYSPQTDTGSASAGFVQMFVEGKGFDVAPTTNFWVGKRFYGRRDVHIANWWPVDMSGVGAGAEVPVGGSTLGVAWFKSDSDAWRLSGNRLNLDWTNLPANADAQLRLVATVADSMDTSTQQGSGGLGLTLEHTQHKVAGGTNTLWLQAANGSAGLDGSLGGLNTGRDTHRWRVADSYTWQNGRVGGQTLAMLQHEKAADGTRTVSSSLGARLSWGLTRNFKLLGEVGLSQRKPDGGARQQLTKLTFAPTLTHGEGFWNRPELRLYVTKAFWNDAANAAAGTNGITGVPAFAGKTSGTSYGVQTEVWF